MVLLAHGQTAFPHADLLLQIEQLDQEIAADPGNAELLVKRGDLYRRHQDFDSAGEDFRAAREVQPDFPRLDFLEGRLYFEMAEYSRAEQLIARHLEHHPEHAAGWVLSGRVHLGMRLTDQAAGDFERAIALANKPAPDLYRQRILSLAAGGEVNAGVALAAVDDALAVFSFEVTILGLGVDIALGADLAEIAQTYLESVPSRLHTLPQWQIRFERSECLERGGEQARAQCLSDTRESLSKQIERFLTEP